MEPEIDFMGPKFNKGCFTHAVQNRFHGARNRSKIGSKTIPKPSKTDFIDAGPFFAANRGPTWGHVGAKLEPSFDQNRYLTSLKFRLRVRRDLEASRARFW